MQSSHYKRFSFLGFSCDLSAFGVFSGVISVIMTVLCVISFVPLYPLWCWSALRNWDNLAVVNHNDGFVHFRSVKPRVFDMTKLDWKLFVVVWILIVGAIPVLISLDAKRERLQRENDRFFEMQRDRKEQQEKERYQMWLDGKITTEEMYGIKDNGSAKSVVRFQPSEELEYYDEHFDDYHDDPEDGITYPDDIFDFYDD